MDEQEKIDFEFMKYLILDKLDSYKNIPFQLKVDIKQILFIYEKQKGFK